jgi:hypothetical protein
MGIKAEWNLLRYKHAREKATTTKNALYGNVGAIGASG